MAFPNKALFEGRHTRVSHIAPEEGERKTSVTYYHSHKQTFLRNSAAGGKCGVRSVRVAEHGRRSRSRRGRVKRKEKEEGSALLTHTQKKECLHAL